MSFEDDLRRFAEKTGQRLEQVARQVAVIAAQGVVMKSPVGNADLWKSKPPPGYVGGRFRAAWTFGVGVVDVSASTDIDPSGAATLARLQGQIATAPVNAVWYLANPLPYAYRLEFEGWSTQAPAGMARVTAAELPQAFAQYVASLKK